MPLTPISTDLTASALRALDDILADRDAIGGDTAASTHEQLQDSARLVHDTAATLELISTVLAAAEKNATHLTRPQGGVLKEAALRDLKVGTSERALPQVAVWDGEVQGDRFLRAMFGVDIDEAARLRAEHEAEVSGYLSVMEQLTAGLHGRAEMHANLHHSTTVGDYQEQLLGLVSSIEDATIPTPYAWGGGSLTGPTLGVTDHGGDADLHGDLEKIGYDCSGLVRYFHYQTTGVELPRTSQDQYRVSTPVDTPRVGDLGFPPGGDPGHVTVYVGDGEMFEAPESGKMLQRSPVPDDYVWRRPPGVPD